MFALSQSPDRTSDVTDEARARVSQKSAIPVQRQWAIGTNTLYRGTLPSQRRAILPRNTFDSNRTLNRYTRLQGLSIARWLYANEGFVKGIVDDMALYSVGSGFTPIAQDTPDLTISDDEVREYYAGLDEPITGKITNQQRHEAAQARAEANNLAHEEYFKDVAKVLNVSGSSLNEDIDLSSKAIDVDGDLGFLLCETDSGFPQYQIWQGHRIGCGMGIVDAAPVSFTAKTPGPDGTTVTVSGKIFDGAIIDDVGRIVGYRLLTDAIGSSYQDVPAWNFIWLGERGRTDEGRTMTNLIHALEKGQDRMEIVDIEIDGVKAALTPSLVLYTDEADDMIGLPSPYDSRVHTPGQPPPPACSGGVAGPAGRHVAPPFPREALRGGMIVRRPKDDKLESHEVNRPTTGLDEFDEVLARPIAQGMGLPLGFVYSPEDLRAPSMRLVTAKAKRRFEKRQRLIIDHLLNRLYFWVISKGINLGVIPATKNPWKVKWQVTQSISVDANKDSAQDRADIWAGHRTLQEDAAERNKDWRQIKFQKAVEAAEDYRLAKRFNVPVERIATISPNPVRDVPNLNEETANAKPAPDDKSGSQEP